MYKRIMVPLDGSARAERAIPVAARLARAAGGVVVLTEIVRAPVEFEVGAAPVAPWVPAAVREERDHAANYLTRIASMRELDGIGTRRCVYAGPVAPALLMAAREQTVDLIVMTTHGRTGLARWALGSVADKVIRHAGMPTLVLPDQASPPPCPQPDALRRVTILVPLDGSTTAESAIVPAAQIAVALSGGGEAALHLVRVVETDVDAAPPWPVDGVAPPPVDDSAALDAAKSYLASLVGEVRAERLAGLPVQVTWSAVLGEQSGALQSDVAAAIIRVAETGEAAEGLGPASRCDLVGMATHGRGGVRRWALGSITDRVLHAIGLPTLVVPPRGAESSPPVSEP